MLIFRARWAWVLILGVLCLGVQTGCTGSRMPPSYDTDVYVAGYEYNDSVPVAKYWKNGKAVSLSDGIHGALAIGITISKGDVYVAGGVNNGSVDVATYWKNGSPVALTDGTRQAFAVGIVVSGADVYVTGYECDPARYNVAVATLWKNGVPTALTDGSGEAQANAVAIDGSDVHVAGWEYQNHQISPNESLITSHAVYWKNNVKTTLTDIATGGGAQGILISGSDVYVCGNEFAGNLGVAKVWKNGAATALTDGTSGAELTGLARLGDNLYASGVELSKEYQAVAKVWKNTAPTPLTQDAYLQAEANGVAVAPLGGTIYAVGTLYGPSIVAAYWQNGQRTNLTDGTHEARARAIAVVQIRHY